MRLLLLVSSLMATAAMASPTQLFHYGALAVDRRNAFAYGWAVDQPSLEDAGQRALLECRKRAKGCHVVLAWSGKGCGAYRTVSESAGTAYGWGGAETREAADAIARAEVAKRSNGQTAPNFVWGCNEPRQPEPFRRIFDAGGQRKPLTLAGHKDAVEAVAISPDSRYVATAALYDGSVRLWETSAGTLVRTFEVDRHGAYDVDFSPDGRLLAIAGRGNDVYLYDVGTGSLVKRLAGHSASVSAVRFTPDGSGLASGAASASRREFGEIDGTVRHWDVHSGRLKSSEGVVFALGVNALAFSPQDGHLVAGGHSLNASGLRALSGSGGSFTPRLDTIVYDVAFSPDGSRVAAAALSGGAYLFDARTRQLVTTFRPKQIGTIRSVAFSPDGAELATGNIDGEVHIWSLADFRQKERIASGDRPVNGLAWAPDGTFLAATAEGRTARLWPREGGSDGPYLEALAKEKAHRAAADKARALQGASDARRRRNEAREKR